MYFIANTIIISSTNRNKLKCGVISLFLGVIQGVSCTLIFVLCLVTLGSKSVCLLWVLFCSFKSNNSTVATLVVCKLVLISRDWDVKLL